MRRSVVLVEPFDLLDGACCSHNHLDMTALDLSISNDSFTEQPMGTTVQIQQRTSDSEAMLFTVLLA